MHCMSARTIHGAWIRYRPAAGRALDPASSGPGKAGRQHCNASYTPGRVRPVSLGARSGPWLLSSRSMATHPVREGQPAI